MQKIGFPSYSAMRKGSLGRRWFGSSLCSKCRKNGTFLTDSLHTSSKSPKITRRTKACDPCASKTRPRMVFPDLASLSMIRPTISRMVQLPLYFSAPLKLWRTGSEQNVKGAFCIAHGSHAKKVIMDDALVMSLIFKFSFAMSKHASSSASGDQAPPTSTCLSWRIVCTKVWVK